MSSIIDNKKAVESILQDHKREIYMLGVRRIGIFGSFVRGDVQPTSDLDLLIEFQAEKKNFDNFMNLSFLLESMFGRHIDLLTPESLSPYLKPYILSEVEYVTIAS